MSIPDFKTMCKALKIYPVVVNEEAIDKVTVFCAKKNNQPGEQTNNESSATKYFEFGDFIRAFKILSRIGY